MTDVPGKPPLSAGTLFVLAAFVVSRICYYAAGIRFDATPVAAYWQYIDSALMQSRLLESLFYLHMQPPGFNPLIGLSEFFCTLLALVMSRNQFHLWYVLVIAAALSMALPKARRIVWWSALPVLVLILSRYLKN